MTTFIAGISQLVTAPDTGSRRGPEMRELKIIPDAGMAIQSGCITWLGRQQDWTGEASEVVDLCGCAVVPGLVDPHTHAVWAGDRLHDFEARSAGATYEEILAAGGGIWHTIRATAERSTEELVALAEPRLSVLLRSGATTVEVKSGYGYSPAAEIRMLEAIRQLQERTKARLSPTLLLHICPKDAKEREEYRETLCAQLIPQVSARGLATAVDIFVEQHAWNANDAGILLRCAQRHGLPVKLHTEQFSNIGGVKLGLELGAQSVDHLEVCSLAQCREIASSCTIATILPGVSLHLGLPAAPGRMLIDSGAAVAIGTDLNPGSSPMFSMALAMAIGVRLNGLTAAEALTASTANAASALGLRDAGRLKVGSRADFLVLNSSDWRDLPYTLGGEMVGQVWLEGKRMEA